jgi:hypothetical protein
MGILFLVLRAVHILGGVFWAGGAIVMFGFVFPSVRATQPGSNGFMQYLTGRAAFPKVMSIVGIITVLAGLGMYTSVSGHFDPGWMRSRHGIALTAGAVIAILALLEGLTVTRVTAMKLGALGSQIAASGAPPTPEQAKTLSALQDRLGSAGGRGAWMLGAAAVLMAIARYL